MVVTMLRTGVFNCCSFQEPCFPGSHSFFYRALSTYKDLDSVGLKHMQSFLPDSRTEHCLYSIFEKILWRQSRSAHVITFVRYYMDFSRFSIHYCIGRGFPEMLLYRPFNSAIVLCGYTYFQYKSPSSFLT